MKLPLSLFGMLPLSVLAKTSYHSIIYIMCDDMGYGDLGCYGQRLIQTPCIDRMAAEGMRFTDAYAGCPVSAPSRCSFMNTVTRFNRSFSVRCIYLPSAYRRSYGSTFLGSSIGEGVRVPRIIRSLLSVRQIISLSAC